MAFLRHPVYPFQRSPPPPPRTPPSLALGNFFLRCVPVRFNQQAGRTTFSCLIGVFQMYISGGKDVTGLLKCLRENFLFISKSVNESKDIQLIDLHLGAFSRRFYPKWLTISTFVRRRETIYWYSKDVHRNKCQAITIAWLCLILNILKMFKYLIRKVFTLD